MVLKLTSNITFSEEKKKSKSCSCGFIINVEGRGWMLAHPANSKNWDFPKGIAEENEDHLEAAMREVREETGLNLSEIMGLSVLDLGQHPYQKQKDLHLFYLNVKEIDTKKMHCESMVINIKGPNFPEMDAFAVFPISLVQSKLTERMWNWVSSHGSDLLLIKETHHG